MLERLIRKTRSIVAPTNRRRRAKLIERGLDRSLYQTYYGDYFWLSSDPQAFVDKCIIDNSMFEKSSTEIVNSLIGPGDIVLDVGANIGYYSVLMSRLVGSSGRVLCFEPTRHYRDVLKKNLQQNAIDNAKVYDFGLSDRHHEAVISIGNSSATLHRPSGVAVEKGSESIRLESLDACFEKLEVERIDFIKIDVDGHEPAFLRGALQTLSRFDSVILLEVNHLNYLESGLSAWDFYDYLVDLGYIIYSEKNREPFSSRNEFLIECGNFAYSANVILSRGELMCNKELQQDR